MIFSRKALAACVTMVVVSGFPVANAASTDQAFASAVAKVLAGVHNDYLDNLSASERKAFVACAQKVMNAAPRPRKEYVLAASNSAEMRERFDEVALDNRAELKKKVSSECAT